MPDERLSMADQLSATYDKLATAEEAPNAGQGDDGPGADSQGSEGTAEDQAAQRARDEAGRFAKADKSDGKAGNRETLTLRPRETKDAAPKQERPEAPADQAKADQAAAGGNSGNQPAANPGAQAPVGPPAHWNGSAKIDWNKIPGSLRESIAKDYEAVGKAQALNQAIGETANTLIQEFGGVDRGIAAILSTWNFARANKLEFVKQFVQHHGIDPQSLGAGQPVQANGEAPGGQEQQDPYAARLQQIETALQQIAQQPVIHQQNQITSEIQNFQTALAPDGSVAHPYYNDVRVRMGALMQTPDLMAIVQSKGGQAALKEAYDQACWGVPSIRAELQREIDRKAADQRKQAVAKAQLAGGSITGSPGVARAETHVSQSVRADLLKNWDAQEARV